MNELIKKFSTLYEFCNEYSNKFILISKKGVHLYQYMESWERFNEINLADKKAFYSELI